MEALQCYASDSESSEPESDQESNKKAKLMEMPNREMGNMVANIGACGEMHSGSSVANSFSLPPPPPDLLTASNSSCVLQLADSHLGRVRSFPHVEGNYALHVYIPVPLSAITRRQLKPLMKAAFSIAPELKPMDLELLSQPASAQTSHEITLPKELHISLSRTVPIRLHQINSIVAMLQTKFEHQKSFWLNLDQWELFVNDERTRSFLSLEVVGQGLSEICRQIDMVNEVFQLHNLPVYYKIPRPHVSVAWALGIVAPSLQKAVEELISNMTYKLPLWSHILKKVECKIGSRIYCIWKEKGQPKALL